MKRAEKATEERHRGEGKRGEMADGAFVESGENGGERTGWSKRRWCVCELVRV